MSKDKKECVNCRDKTTCGQGIRDVRGYGCSQWSRSPRLWLDILPTEPGWYWFRGGPYTNDPQASRVRYIGPLLCVAPNDLWHPIEKMVGQWQGPITPKEDT